MKNGKQVKRLKKGKKEGKMIAKHEKKLQKRIIEDFDKLLELSIYSGSIFKGSIRDLLKQISTDLACVEKNHGPIKQLRKPGRFLDHLHRKHGKIIKSGELAKELHDQQTLVLIKRWMAKGKSSDEITRKLCEQGERVTLGAIARVLDGKFQRVTH